MQPNSSQGLYGSEYLQAAMKYGIDPYDLTKPSYNPAAARAMHGHMAKLKAKAKHTPAAAQAPAQTQPRQEDEHEIGDGLEENYFALVSTEELEKQGLKAHPDKIAEAAALSSVSLPAGSYKMCLPAQVIQGRISALQFQAIRLACQKHETFLPDGSRAGFFLGDGPGVGKGRQIASLVFENILRGRTKAVWFSASGDLAFDAKRDFHDIGALQYEPVELHDLRHCKVKAGGKLGDAQELSRGILFSTYDLLIAGKTRGPKAKTAATPGSDAMAGTAPAAPEDLGRLEFGAGSRLQQIVEWLGGETFDGALVFDECHKAKNCIAKQVTGSSRKQSESKTSRAVVEIQKRLPNARVLYVSATGATEAENLCYMTRLGLWGDKTAFRNKLDFVSMLQQRGVAAMELVAMELKQSGSFIARTLSYEGVEFEQVHVDISASYKEMYDAAAALWLEVKEAIDSCKETKLIEGTLAKSIAGQYYSAHLRFFRQLCTAAKVDKVSMLAQEVLDQGKCVVIGLQSTGEARTEAMVAAKGKATGEDDNDFDSFVEPAGLILSTVIGMMPGEYHDKARLLREAQKMKLPGNPLDELIERLGGVDAVAEMSGRKRRMVKQPNGSYKYCLRSSGEVALEKVNIHEKDAFQEGRKLVAVISDAASTGISLQADCSKPNTRQRVHITLELAWSADKTVQQLGRTHRSNQKQPPKYLIVSTDISGEHRFASAVACRLQQLGALTHGDRHAASAADALSSSNLQNKFSQSALRKMYKILLGQQEPPDDVIPDFMKEELSGVGNAAQQTMERGRFLKAFIPDAKDALTEVNVLKEGAVSDVEKEISMRKEENKTSPGGNINKLLNRLLGCQVDIQSKIFSYFMALTDAEVKMAKLAGKYDDCGIIKPHGESIAFKKKEIIYQDDYSGMCTYHAEFEIDRGMNYDAAVRVLEQERKEDPDTLCGFYRVKVEHTGRIYHVLALPRDAQGRKLKKTAFARRGGNSAAYYRVMRPASGFSSTDYDADKFAETYNAVKETPSLKVNWNEEWKADSNRNRRQNLHLITGSILPILPTITQQLKKNKLQVMRVESTDGKKQEIGLYLDPPTAVKVLEKVRSLQPYKPWQFKTVGKEGEGAKDPDNTLADSQRHMNAASGPAPPLADGILDVCSSPDSSAAPKAGCKSKGDKENRPKAARAKGEKRAKRTGRGLAEAQTVDLLEDAVVEPEHMLSRGLWEDITLPALKKVQEARKPAPKPAKKAEPLFDSASDSEEESAEMEEDSSSESPDAGKKTASKSAGRTPRTVHASSKKAAKAITAACADLEEEASEKDDSSSTTDSEAATERNESPVPAAATVEQKKGRELSSQKKKRRGSKSPSHDSAAETERVRKQGTNSSSPEGSSRQAVEEELVTKSAKKSGKLPASDDSTGLSDSEAESAAEEEADPEAESPIPVMLKSRKLQKADGTTVQSKTDDTNRGRSSSSDREPIQSNSAFSNGWQVRCKCGVTDDDGEHMVECEGGCKTWVHLKCHKIKLGHDWFCDKCQQAVHSSKAHSDDVDDPMDEPAGAGPGDAPSSDALADAAPGAKTDRATASNAADGGLTRAVEHPDTGKKGLRAAGSSPDGSRAAEDIELDLSPAVSPATKSTSKTLKKSKLAVSTGGVKKHSNKGKKALRAIALKGLEAADSKSPSSSPAPSNSSPRGAEEEQEPERDGSSSPSSGSQQAGDGSPAAEVSPESSLEPERQKSTSPVGSVPDGDALDTSGDPSGPGVDTEAAFEDSIDPQGVTPVPSSTAFKRLVRHSAALDPDSRSGPEAAGGLPGLTPGRITPGKATPNKRAREAVRSSPAGNSPVVGAEHHSGPEGGLPEGTPGKRRRSLLPQSSTDLNDRSQGDHSHTGVGSEAANWKSRCAELEAAAAQQKAIEQERAKKEVALEAELRRSIETSLAERVRQEKLNLSRKALEMGKQKGMQEAEKKSQSQLEALRAEKQSTAERLQAVQSESQAVAAQLQTLQLDKQAASQQVQSMREEVQTVQQRLQAIDADKAAAAEQLHASRLALQRERAEWEQQRQEWEAERSAKADRERQLQQDMAAMHAMLEEYKFLLQSGKKAEQDRSRAEAGTDSMTKAQVQGKLQRPSTAVPLTPGNAHDGSSSDDTAQPTMSQQQTPAAAGLSGEAVNRALAAKTLSPGVDACTPARTVLEFGSASGIADKRDSGTASSSKRVSWAPLPMLGGEAEPQETAEAEVLCEQIVKENVLTWVEGVTTASMEEIAKGVKATRQMSSLKQILQELQNDFEIATKAGKYFVL